MSRSPSPPTTVSRRRRKRASRSPNKATIEVITISDDEKTPSPKRKNYKSPHNEIVLITTPSPPKSPYRPRQYPAWVYRKSSSKSKSKSKSSSGSSSSKSPSPRRRRPTPPSPIPPFSRSTPPGQRGYVVASPFRRNLPKSSPSKHRYDDQQHMDLESVRFNPDTMLFEYDDNVDPASNLMLQFMTEDDLARYM